MRMRGDICFGFKCKRLVIIIIIRMFLLIHFQSSLFSHKLSQKKSLCLIVFLSFLLAIIISCFFRPVQIMNYIVCLLSLFLESKMINVLTQNIKKQRLN